MTTFFPGFQSLKSTSGFNSSVGPRGAVNSYDHFLQLFLINAFNLTGPLHSGWREEDLIHRNSVSMAQSGVQPIKSLSVG